MFKLHFARLALLITLPALLAHNVSAATRFWDGGGANGFWDTAANWSNNVAPANGDALFFPTNVARLINTNRTSGNLTNFSTIRFTGDGYNVFSVPFINLTNGVTNAGPVSSANTLNAGLTLRGNQTWAVGGRNTLTANSNLVWSGFALTNAIDGTLILNGIFNGGVGAQLTKLGAGRLELNGTPNTVPIMRVIDGTLQVDGSLVAGAGLIISNGASLIGTGSVSAFTCAGDFSPAGTSTPGLMTMTGTGNATFASGARFFATINGLVPGTDYDQFRTPSPPNLSGATLLVLRSASFPFGIGQKFVIITNTGVSVITTTFTNLAQNARLTNNGVAFQISYSGGSGNDVELTVVDSPFVATGVTREWDGGGATAFFSDPANWVADVAPQDGDSILFPTGMGTFNNLATNNLAIRFDRLLCNSNGAGMTLRGQPLRLAGGIISTQASGVLTVFNDISFTGNASIQNTDARVLLHGSVDNGGNNLLLTGGPASLEINGVLSGDGGLVVSRTGGAILGNGNTYRGTTRLLLGQLIATAPGSLGDATSEPTFVGSGVNLTVSSTRLFESSITVTGFINFSTTTNVQSVIEVRGTNARVQGGPDDSIHLHGPLLGDGRLDLPQGEVFIENTHAITGQGIQIGSKQGVHFNGSGSSAVRLLGFHAALGGTGEVGTVTMIAGQASIAPGNSPGILTTSNLLFNVNVTNVFELNGLAPGGGHDQLRVHGTVDLGNAVLQLAVGFTPATGSTFAIIDNDGTDAVTGIYAGLPEGSLVADGAQAFRISYVGGTGNDVVLTAVDGVFIPSGVTRTWDGGAGAGNRNWSATANWDGNVLPARGDNLVFPADAPSNTRINANNLAITNTIYNRIAFGGLGNTWIIQGNALKIFGGIIATNESGLGNASLGNASVELIGPQSWNCTNVNLAVNTPLFLGGHTLTLASGSGGAIFLQNPIIGPGALVMGAGEVFVFADSGISDVPVTIQGAVVFAGSGVNVGPAWQMIGGSLKLGPTQIPGLNMTAGTLDLSLQSGATNAGNLTLSAACTVASRFDFIGAGAPPSLIVTGLVTLGGATLRVGPADFSLLNTPIKLIEKTSAGPVTGTFAGLPEGAFISATNEFNGLVTRYRVSYIGGSGNDVTLTPVAPAPTGLTRTWTGAGADPMWSTAPNWTGNTPPANGDSAVFPFAAAQRNNTNPAPGLVLNNIQWNGSNYHHAGTFTLIAGLNHAAAGTNTIAIAPLLATLGAQTWSVSNAAATLRIIEETDEDSGEILGLGPVTKTGAGTLELVHLSLRAAEGLVVDGGTARLLDVFFDNNSPLHLRQGRIDATAVGVGSLIATNGELALRFRADEDENLVVGGLSSAQPVAFTSNLTLTVHWTNGAPAALTTDGLDLGNARLNATFPPSLPSQDSIIVARYFLGSLSGTFANLPEGAITNFGGRAWQILYNVALPDESSDNRFIILAPPVSTPVFTSIERLGNGDVVLHGTASPGVTVNIEASETLEAFTFIGSTVASGAGQFTFIDSSGALNQRFYQAVLPAP